MDEEALTAQVIRVTRPDTLMVRTHVPQLQSQATVHCVIHGVTTDASAVPHIVDWVESHADFGRIRLVTDWLRDPYGRVLADLADIQSGESLSSYLLAQGCADKWDTHYVDTFRELMQAEEPDDTGW